MKFTLVTLKEERMTQSLVHGIRREEGGGEGGGGGRITRERGKVACLMKCLRC
jgi:hypothetical protein